MNTDKIGSIDRRRLVRDLPSVFIRVHLWFSMNFALRRLVAAGSLC
jgi:hypothetical protein